MTSIPDPFDVRILLVDDDDFMRQVIHQALSGLGYRNVTEEDDGSRAEHRLQALRYDLILTDVQMPEMNGLELLKRIRCGRTGAPSDARVLIITSFSNTEVLRAAIALDVNGFLVKPMKPSSVREKISQAMRGRLKLRDSLAYEEVNTDLGTIAQPDEAPTHGPASPQASIVLSGHPCAPIAHSPASHLDASHVSVFSLEPGMVLCEDLRLKDGTLILSPNHALSENTINRLMELRGLLRDELVWVRAAAPSA